MPLVGRLDLPRITSDTSIHDHTANYSAIWGYTDSVTHREYAVLGCYTGTSIIDITDSAVEVGWIPGLPSIWREMKTFSHYAYVCTESRGQGQGIQIIDLKNPRAPRLVGVFDSTLISSHTLSIEGKKLYCNGSSNSLRILDLTNPEHPRDIGIDTANILPYIHDSYIRHDTMYASHIYNGTGVGIYDVRIPQTPKQITVFNYPLAGTHNSWLTDDSKFLVTTDEINCPQRNCKVWDIHDLHNITQIAQFSLSDTEVAHNVVIKGRYAYVAHYSAGVGVWDIFNPAIPVLMGFYDTYPEVVAGYKYEGAWGVYPLFASGKIITDDRTHGLFVNTLQTFPVGRVRVTLVDSATLAPLQQVSIRLSTEALAGTPGDVRGVTDINGVVSVGVTDTGSATLTVERGQSKSPLTMSVHLVADSTISVRLRIGETSLSVHAPNTVSDFILQPSYPNPASEVMTLRYASGHEVTARINLIDMTGACRYSSSVHLTTGTNAFTILVHTMAAGAYIATVTVGERTTMQPMTISR